MHRYRDIDFKSGPAIVYVFESKFFYRHVITDGKLYVQVTVLLAFQISQAEPDNVQAGTACTVSRARSNIAVARYICLSIQSHDLCVIGICILARLAFSISHSITRYAKAILESCLNIMSSNLVPFYKADVHLNGFWLYISKPVDELRVEGNLRGTATFTEIEFENSV